MELALGWGWIAVLDDVILWDTEEHRRLVVAANRCPITEKAQMELNHA